MLIRTAVVSVAVLVGCSATVSSGCDAPDRNLRPTSNLRVVSPLASSDCEVLQAAFTKEVGGGRVGYPTDLAEAVASDHFFVNDEFLRALSLRDTERAIFTGRAVYHTSAPYLPDCHWAGRPTPVSESGMKMTTTFLKPLYSKDGTLALVHWSLDARPYSWAHGFGCIVRRETAAWSAKCVPTWLT